MNQFLNKFQERITTYWDEISEEEENQLLDDILQYANSNPQSFKSDLQKVRFDPELTPLPVVLEALSYDTTNWGQFYVDLLNDILETANQVDKPQTILSSLMEFSYIEQDENPFVQKIVDRLYRSLDSDNIHIKLVCIYTLPGYLGNKTIKNSKVITAALQQKLNDDNWKVRVVAFRALGYENLLPEGFRLSLKDRLLKLILGEPRVY